MSSPEPTTAVAIPDLLNPDSYPRRGELTETCDLVMKGGITSGVIYPHTVCELATARRLVQVGGTSAGAIAAGGAAAAEYGRDTHSPASGFPQLASLPSQLAEQTRRRAHPFVPSLSGSGRDDGRCIALCPC